MFRLERKIANRVFVNDRTLENICLLGVYPNPKKPLIPFCIVPTAICEFVLRVQKAVGKLLWSHLCSSQRSRASIRSRIRLVVYFAPSLVIVKPIHRHRPMVFQVKRMKVSWIFRFHGSNNAR